MVNYTRGSWIWTSFFFLILGSFQEVFQEVLFITKVIHSSAQGLMQLCGARDQNLGLIHIRGCSLAIWDLSGHCLGLNPSSTTFMVVALGVCFFICKWKKTKTLTLSIYFLLREGSFGTTPGSVWRLLLVMLEMEPELFPCQVSILPPVLPLQPIWYLFYISHGSNNVRSGKWSFPGF